MSVHARLRSFLLFAIIIIGGFGLARMTLVRRDPLGLSAIILALTLSWVFKRLAVSKSGAALRGMGISQSKWPMRLAGAANDSFEVFAGRPKSYAGYTDYTAMSVDVNDDLAKRQPEEQYVLLGFGNGFLHGIRNRIDDGDLEGRLHVRVLDACQEFKESLGWLAYLQQSGTDNAGPSTENLHGVIQFVATAIVTKGPITMGYWDKLHNERSESFDASGTTPEVLEEWTNSYRAAFDEGHRQALCAVMLAKPS